MNEISSHPSRTNNLGRLDPDNERILVTIAQYDTGAFRELYRCYFPRIYTYIRLRVETIEDAEDLVADIFLCLVEKLDSFTWRGEGSFAAWLFRIARNRVNDFYRREKRQAVEILDELSLFENINSDGNEMVIELRELVRRLPRRRREVICLKFFGGLRNREIAMILGINEKSVASHLCRGLNDLYQEYVYERGEVENETTK